MRSATTSMGLTWALMAALAVATIGMTACSSQQEDAEARGENVKMSTQAQDKVEQAAMQSQQEAATTTSTSASTAATASDDSVIVSENADEVSQIDNTQLGTHDNDDIADGTDTEENVSTY